MEYLSSQSRGRETLVRSLADFFKRDLIAIPLVKKHPHSTITQNCGLKAATLELDTAAYPNIEYVAGTRLSVYPANPADHVEAVIKHLIDDVGPQIKRLKSNQQHPQQQQPAKQESSNDRWSKFVSHNGRDSLRMALTYLYDITTAPTRELLFIMADNCTNREQKARLLTLARSDEIWEKWICHNLRTLKSTLEEFNSCQMSAKTLFSELELQQPRQYSISNIKSSKRFRAEIVVVQHKFTPQQIAASLQTIKDREKLQQLEMATLANNSNRVRSDIAGKIVRSPTGSTGATPVQPVSQRQSRRSMSIRSVRSVPTFNSNSPITTHQVRKLANYSGPVMSMYAASSLTSNVSLRSSTGSQGSTIHRQQALSQASSVDRDHTKSPNSSSSGGASKSFDGLCSNYLLNLNHNDHVICEFVENPRFTLKGNRERPVMMIGQDVGVIAFRPFWQQRILEHDRAQVFYTLFKDLSPKKFGDMQLVCLTGNRCRVEDLFRREIGAALTNKVLSSASYIERSHFVKLLDLAANASKPQIKIESRELVELGHRIYRLLMEQNGCLYTCCDPQMTQAIEILACNCGENTQQMMSLLPKWKGRATSNDQKTPGKFVFTLENPFERAQIVQEIYESSI